MTYPPPSLAITSVTCREREGGERGGGEREGGRGEGGGLERECVEV